MIEDYYGDTVNIRIQVLDEVGLPFQFSGDPVIYFRVLSEYSLSTLDEINSLSSPDRIYRKNEYIYIMYDSRRIKNQGYYRARCVFTERGAIKTILDTRLLLN